MHVCILSEGTWRLSKKGKKRERFFGTQLTKELSPGRWLKRLGLVRATPWADFAAIGDQL